MGKDFNLESQLKSTYKFLLKMNDLQEVQRNHSVLKNLNTLYPGDIKRIYKNERSFYRIGKKYL
jgi:hypothetical protein